MPLPREELINRIQHAIDEYLAVDSGDINSYELAQCIVEHVQTPIPPTKSRAEVIQERLKEM